mgnify:CR=1 FL=1|tara:strand:+ start:178 stop:327 length:150 start_codon:yes stop_codon:yes gene_type:complete
MYKHYDEVNGDLVLVGYHIMSGKSWFYVKKENLIRLGEDKKVTNIAKIK